MSRSRKRRATKDGALAARVPAPSATAKRRPSPPGRVVHRRTPWEWIAASGLLVIVVVAVFVFAQQSGLTGSTQSPGLAAGAEALGGEAAPIRYADPRYHYLIDAPGQMTANPNGTASFIGPSERLEIAVVTGSRASDIAALASQDSQSLAVSASGFRQLSRPSTVTLSGHSVTKFSYAWNAGTSVVTGKPVDLTTVRYYVSKDSATVAVITYGIVSNQFDPQGADDVASTFKWQ